jgi:hypothetical protein
MPAFTELSAFSPDAEVVATAIADRIKMEPAMRLNLDINFLFGF